MKKVFVLLCAAMMVANCFATTPAEASNFDLSLNFKELASELKLEPEFVPEFKVAGKNLEKRVANLANVMPEKRQEKLSTYLLNNLSVVKSITTAEQYRLYLNWLNRQFNENNLNAILFGYDEFDYVAVQ